MRQADALELTALLRDPRIENWDVLVVRAYDGRTWAALGYRDWNQYCCCELAGVRDGVRPRLSSERRQTLVHNLTEFELPTRAIASALNIGVRTVISDRRQMKALIAATVAELRKGWRNEEAARNALGAEQ